MGESVCLEHHQSSTCQVLPSDAVSNSLTYFKAQTVPLNEGIHRGPKGSRVVGEYRPHDSDQRRQSLIHMGICHRVLRWTARDLALIAGIEVIVDPIADQISASSLSLEAKRIGY